MSRMYYRAASNQYAYRHELVDQTGANSHDFVLHIEPLVQYRFQRQASNLAQVTATVLAQLRKQYGTLRLFYSGGLDSQFVLHHFLANHVQLDEIYSVVKTPYNDDVLLALDESVNSAQPFLQQEADQLLQTQIHLPVLDHAFFDQFYSSDDYWKYSFLMYLGEPSRVCNMIDAFSLDITDHCNLTGIDTPFVYWDQAWKFCFVDQQIISEYVSKHSCAAYSLSLNSPEFIEAYVNTIVDQMEKYPDYQSRFSRNNVLQYRSKFIQRMVPEMQVVNGQTWGLRLPKSTGVPVPNTASFMEKTVYANFRSLMHWQRAQQEQPAWLDRWINYTDWQWVEKCHQFGGVFSDQFVLND